MRFALATAAALLATPATADGVTVRDAYARFLPGAMSGAAFLIVENDGTSDDRLVSAASEAAQRVELHTHAMAADGTMQMRQIEGGIIVPAHSTHALERGGDHVMFMGISGPVGDSITLTLTFEHAGELTIEVPVDNSR